MTDDMERPYISFGQTYRPAGEEHYDATQLLVIDILRRYTGSLMDAMSKETHLLERLVSEQVMEKAYYSSLFGRLRLMGAQEAAEALGVRRQRVGQLSRENDQFPGPVAQLACGPIWIAEDIERFAKRKRPPGRPKKEKET